MRPDTADVRPDATDVRAETAAEVATDVAVDRTEVATDVAVDRTEVATDVAVDRTEVATEVAADVQPDVVPSVDLGCTNACTLGAKQCGTGGGSQTCVAGGNGCTVWAAEVACGAHQTCNAGTCACVTAPAGCTAPGTFCSGGEVKTCTRDAQECLFVSASATCATNTSCKGTLPTAACSCDNTCATLGAFCVDSKHTSNCVADTNSPACKIASTSQLCPGTSSCVNGACACPAAGTTTGTGCTLNAAALCEGDDILTCVTDSDSGCNIWQASTHCGNNVGGRLTCGKPAGTAICVCPANGTTDEYVDPAAGSDTAAGVYPTGIDTPSNCRWATLSKGLAEVPVNGRVIATSAAAPVTFGAETFPLNVPAGVQLTTSDATATPANYTINFNSGGAVNAVVLSTGSTLRGYSLTNTTGNAAASAIACASGTATVNTVNIDGSGTTVLTRGIDITGSCAASLTSVALQSFTGVAINVNTSSSGVVITGGSATTSLNGLRIQSGGVTATNFGANNNSGGGISLETGSPSLSITGGSITENGVAGINLAKGTLTATGTNVNGNMGAGILAASGTSATLTSVTTNSNGQGGTADGLVANGATVMATSHTSNGNTRAGVVATGTAAVSLRGATVAMNATRGVYQTGTGSTVLIDQAASTGSVIGPNTGSGVESSAGTLTIFGNSEIKNNGIHGVHLLGAVATINSAKIHDNTVNGIYVNSSAVVINVGSSLAVTELSANGAHGIRIDAAALTPSSANPVTIDTVKSFSNGLSGIYLAGTAGDVAATIQNSTVNGNGDTGVLIEQVAGTTRSFFQTNDVFGNNTNNGHMVGGILFNSPSTLQTFIANKVHSNGGDELGFNALPNLPATAWSITTASGMCDAQSNSLYCYGSGFVGLRVIPAGVSVNAQRVHWVNTAPTFNVDYSAPLAAQVDSTNACSTIPTCP